MAKRKNTKGNKGQDAEKGAIPVSQEWLKAGIAVFDAMVKDRGQIKDLEAKVEGAKDSTAGRLLKLAQDVQADGKGVDVFLAICKATEAHEKQKHNVTNLRMVCPTWVQVKSDIKKAWEYTDKKGDHPFLPSKFTSAQTLKEELREATKKPENKPKGQTEKVFGEVSDDVREAAETAVKYIRRATESPEVAEAVLENLRQFNAAMEAALADVLGEAVPRPAKEAPEGMQEATA